MFELMDAHSQSAVIKVIGVGGGGGNAVAHMVNAGIEGVDFICANTDAQALNSARVRTALQIGCNITKGLGAGADPDIGRQAGMEDRDRIQEVIEGADMLFITAGMGGGTGTGAAPIFHCGRRRNMPRKSRSSTRAPCRSSRIRTKPLKFPVLESGRRGVLHGKHWQKSSNRDSRNCSA